MLSGSAAIVAASQIDPVLCRTDFVLLFDLFTAGIGRAGAHVMFLIYAMTPCANI